MFPLVADFQAVDTFVIPSETEEVTASTMVVAPPSLVIPIASFARLNIDVKYNRQNEMEDLMYKNLPGYL